MSLRGPVLVAIDFSDASDEALRQGHAIATAIGARLVVGHVLPEAFRVRVLFPHQAGFDAAQQTELDEKARAATRDRVEAVLGTIYGCAIEIDSGTAHAGILAIADRAGAALIVAGPGPTSQRVARACLTDVLTARRSPAAGTVLGATDFSDPALPAVRMAADESSRRGTALRLIHCLDLEPTWSLGPVIAPGMIAATLLPQDVIDQLSTSALERLEAALMSTGRTGEAVVAFGAPGHRIVEAAEQCGASLIVVGTRGRTGLSRLALGSTAEYVMGHAACSVLTVPLQVPFG